MQVNIMKNEIPSLIKKVDWTFLIKNGILNKSEKETIVNFENKRIRDIFRDLRVIIERNLRMIYKKKISNQRESISYMLGQLQLNKILPPQIHSFYHLIRASANAHSHANEKYDYEDIHESLVFDIVFSVFLELLKWVESIQLGNKKTKNSELEYRIKDIKTKLREIHSDSLMDFNFSNFVNPNFLLDAFNKKEEQQIDFSEFLRTLSEKLKDGMFLILMGDSGIGKSTIIAAINHKINNLDFLSELIPIIIPLRGFPKEKEMILQNLKNNIYEFIKQEIDDNIEDLIKEGKVIFLLDGLDEYFVKVNNNIGRIDTIIESLNQLQKRYGWNIILTTRFTIWSSKKHISYKINEEQIYIIDNFSDDQIEEWVRKRLQKKGIIGYGYKEIIKILKSKIHKEILRTPLYLSLLFENIDQFLNLEDKLSLTFQLYQIIIKNDIRKYLNVTPYDISSDFLKKILYNASLEANISSEFSFTNSFKNKSIFTKEEEIYLNNLSKKPEEIRSLFRSFSFFTLNQNNQDLIKFSHQNFSDYLIAKAAFKEISHKLYDDKNKITNHFFTAKSLNLNSFNFFLDILNKKLPQSYFKFFKFSDFESFLNIPCDSFLFQELLNLYGRVFENSPQFKTQLEILLKKSFENKRDLLFDYYTFAQPIQTFFLLENSFDFLKDNHFNVIDLRNFPYKNFPAPLFEQKKLRSLIIYGWKNLCYISEEIGELTNLRYLVLKDNSIEKIPKKMVELKKLYHINLNRNKIYEIPNEIIILPRLHTLKIAFNPIRKLKVFWNKSPKLTNLVIDWNNFEIFLKNNHFPETFTSLIILLKSISDKGSALSEKSPKRYLSSNFENLKEKILVDSNLLKRDYEEIHFKKINRIELNDLFKSMCLNY